MLFFILILLINLLLILNVKSEKCSWNNCPKWSTSPNIINVHIVPHSHDDMGWIKTVDDYYTGANPRLVPVGVQYIINTVIDELLKNKSRRFCYAEAGFLHRWLLDHNNEQREQLKYLVENGQLEIIGGGWTQPDEPENSILTSAFLRGTYSPPNGFCFDVLCNDDPIIDNKQFEGYNVDKRLEEFYKYINNSVNKQLHKNILMTMGGDFQYSNANQWFTQLDKLINAINIQTNKTGVYAFYSTPSCYANALEFFELNLPKNKSFPSKINGDFFPYASSNHSYWTGYFTSKPAFKGLVRSSSALLQLTRKLASFSNIFQKSFYCQINECEPSFTSLLQLEGAIALSTHHDAITGTSKHNVTIDYIKRLLFGWDQAEKVLNNSFWNISSIFKQSEYVPSLIFCRKLNESVKQIKKFIRIPLYIKSEEIKIINYNGKEINFEIIKTFLRGNEQNSENIFPYELIFEAQIPPLGFTTYFMLINKTLNNNEEILLNKKEIRQNINNFEKNKIIEISNNFFRLTFGSNGLLKEIQDIKRLNITYPLNQQFFYYRGMKNITEDGHYQQSSGAYIFRPNGSIPQPFEEPIQNIQLIKNSLVQEVRQIINPWISQIIRLFPNKPFIEFQWIIGPLPKNKKLLESTEVITRYTIEGFNSSKIFWTDSNGRTEPAAGNYFPVNSRIWIEDSETRMTILTDRSQGGTSLNDGQIELMLHRRCFFDDGWGVEEPLDEPGEDGKGLIVQGKHWLLFNSKTNEEHRPLAFELFEENVPQAIAFIPLDNFILGNITLYKELYRTKFSGLSINSLPSTVHLLTLTPIGNLNNELLIRLEHYYQKNELKLRKTNIEQINIKKLFLPYIIVLSAEELALGADRPIENNKTKKEENLIISLKPMEIRTFKLKIKYNNNNNNFY